MKVEIWSDFACPFCYIGKRHLEGALEQFEHRDKVEVVYKSFQLDPNAQKNTGKDIHARLAEKLGMPYSRAKEMNEQMIVRARESGLTYRFDTLIPTNTFDALRLSHHAKDQGKAQEWMEQVFIAYFTDSLDIGDHDTLAGLAGEIGLDSGEARRVLSEGMYGEEVKNDHQEGSQLGINGVPFYVIDRKYAVSGAQPGSVFLEGLNKAWEDAHSLKMVNGAASRGNSGDGCDDGSCTLQDDGSCTL